MKRLIVVMVCLVGLGVMAAPASAVTLGYSDLIGTMINGVPNDITSEGLMAQKLIDEYSSAPASGIFNPPGPLNETWRVYSTGIVGPLPDVTLTGATKDESAPFLPISLTPTSYQYLFAHFGGYSALFYLNGYSTIDGINTTNVQPASVTGGGLSSVTLFNPTQVPEAGALLLFGTGLIGLVGYRRARRMH